MSSSTSPKRGKVGVWFIAPISLIVWVIEISLATSAMGNLYPRGRLVDIASVATVATLVASIAAAAAALLIEKTGATRAATVLRLATISVSALILITAVLMVLVARGTFD